ncbi:MAG: sensor histidine kinase [Streptococcaceae bacterium]|jgi:signal transduction histidine kinase|nr:sensor histidine kinase [Streptococcaceae bacterium]
MLWFDYLKTKIPQIFVFFFMSFLYIATFLMWHLPLQALANSTLFALVIFILYLVSSFFRWRNVQREIAEMQAENARLLSEIKEMKLSQKEFFDLIRVWSHQMKVPLSAIDLMTQTNEKISAKALEAQTFNLNNYLNILLETLRLRNLSTDFRFQTVDVAEICRELVKKYSIFFINKGLSVTFEGAWQITTDRRWLTLALEQLINNAVKYTKTGGLAFKFEKNSMTLTDTGIGILPEDLPRLFDHGFTGFNGRSNQKSTGLGLYLAKLILDKLDFTISVTSEIDKGTKILIQK